MDGDPGNLILKIIILFALILVNAFFAMSEIAIISLNDTKIQRLAEEGDKKAKNDSKEGENIDDLGKKSISEKDELVTEICKKEHENWVDMRERLGWSRGSKKDDEKKTNPNLVPWERLRPNVKKANKKTIERLPEFCETVGLKIVKDK